MRRALEYARMLNRPIFAVPQDATLSAGGLMHEGYYSRSLAYVEFLPLQKRLWWAGISL